MRNSAFFRLLTIPGVCFVLIVSAGAQKKGVAQARPHIPENLLERLEWRCIGPAIMGGRIDDFAVVERDPDIIYAATASGGLWKTVNNGVTWEPIFDDQSTSSIGDVTIAPSSPDIVWVGTGESNNRQSSSWGDGVYKSEDAGLTWKNMGLQDSHHIGRIIIHPQNPDIVYVAALGRLWGPNTERGLFRTVDGGRTWENTKFIDENTGFVDLAIDPENPSTLYGAAYQRRRTTYGFNGGGPGSGLYKTTDGGDTWVRLTNGLPGGTTGRIGLEVYRRNPSIVYAVIEHKEGGVFRSEDKGLTWKRMSTTNPRPMYYSKIRIDPNNDQRIWVLGASMYVSEDGGKTFRTDFVREIHGDYHAMWINPADSGHLVVGSDGGIHISYDYGLTWDFVNSLPIAQFYEVGFDMRRPYYVYGGLQDNGSWGAPSATWTSAGITNDEWVRVGGGDGFYTRVDPEDHNTVYAESQDGHLFRFDLRSGESKSIRPESVDDTETYRFNWNSPVLVSSHNPRKIFYGGNKLFISRDRGDNWEDTVDLTTQTDREKLPIMGVVPDATTLSRNDGVAHYGTITAVAESPLREGILYVGTDDGLVQVSRDDGKSWQEASPPGSLVPRGTYVSRLETSRFGEGRVYATFDGHRGNDFKPYVLVSEDFGATWKSLSFRLPEFSTVSVVREDLRNPDLLFIGTERGAHFSLDRGGNWFLFKGNLPVVPVDDIAIHPREYDLIFGTHGRGVWILDDMTLLSQITADTLAAQSHLFDIRPALIFNPHSHKAYTGHKFFVGPNPPRGALISYYLKEGGQEDAKITITDPQGNPIREFKGAKEAGLHRLTWDLRYPPAGGEERTGGRRFSLPAPHVLPGEYLVTLQAGGLETAKTVKVEGDSRIEVSDADRLAQHDVLMDIYRHAPLLSAAEKTLNSLQSRLEDAAEMTKKAPGAPSGVAEEIRKVLAEVQAVRKEIFGDPQAGFQAARLSVRGRLFSLARSIGSYTGAPSERQVQGVALNTEKLTTLVEKINTIIDETIPRLNKMMNENNIPYISPVQKLKLS